jgi:hypothetical protein
VHLACQFLLGQRLELAQVLLLAVAHLLYQVRSSGLVFVHELVPFAAKLLELGSLGLLSRLQLAVVQQTQVLVSTLELALSDLLHLALGVPGLGIAAVALALLAVVVEQPVWEGRYLRKSMSLGSTVRHSAYFSSSPVADCWLRA